MNRIRRIVIGTSASVALLVLPLSSVGAQQGQAPATFDGQSLTTQSQTTQQMFSGTWGAQAPQRWATEHEGELRARGITPGQTGAQAGAANQTGQGSQA